jgi:CheY-like chemotaxis protein
MSQLHALIIDDNAKNTAVLAGLLAHQGFSVTKILDNRLLSSLLEEVEKVDVVFLDLEMPGRNGYDILENLQADSRFDSVPIVAYTVHVSEMNIAHQQGFHSFLAKPLDADRFPDQLERILRGVPVWERE